MGNIIKINIYFSEFGIKKKSKLKLENIEEVILKYYTWIKNDNREDKIETYKEFLRAQ